ncbi:uncharacterized protein M6B38_374100 [Iris pallida]|uniref:Uncharacterized protein n=1 Tax=Iris pallida TaxID=29817 RepID=A0AAX6GD12_IRIPA|nr:uncharacterized protein M6B38_374100 [Iris pallida]
MSILGIINPNANILSTSRIFPFRRNPNPNSSFLVLRCFSASSSAKESPKSGANPNPNSKKRPPRAQKPDAPPQPPVVAPSDPFPTTKPRRPRRGRRSEAAAVEDFVRGSLERTFASIRRQNAEVLEGKEDPDKILKEEEEEEEEAGAVVEEEDPEWPVDADVGWGVRASEYFERHPIRNVVAEDGVEIDWEGEMEEGWVKEINCLEWESFAFHPSPLIVLVFERYNRAADNWKLLKELEKAAKVYWSAKDRLPPRTVKIDINIETDLAYALKVKECPQLLFLKGNKILYREKESRTADELVHMIAHFYYNAKRPSWIDPTAIVPPF